jgi:hypothetical protein
MPAFAAEWKLVYRRGEPIADREKGWDGHVDRASWVDDDRIVYGTIGKEIQCVSTSKDKVVWSIKTPSDLRDWTLCRQTRRLAFLEREKDECLGQQLTVVNCDDGTRNCVAVFYGGANSLRD